MAEITAADRAAGAALERKLLDTPILEWPAVLSQALANARCQGGEGGAPPPLPDLNLEELPDRQRELFTFLVAFRSERHFPPSVTEIGKAMGLGRHSVHYHLTQLQKKGYIFREPRVARGLTILRGTE